MILTAYVAVKGTYQAATFEERIEERNLLYIAPLLTIALAHFAATRQIRVWALALAAALTAWSIDSLPLNLAGLEGDAPGLAILSRWHDDYELGFTSAHQILYGLIALSVLVGLAPMLLQPAARRRPGSSSAPSCSRSAGRPGPRRRRRRTRTTSPTSSTTGSRSRSNWIDEATGGKPAVYIGQKIADPNGIWSMEFWNRNVRRVWSLDGTAPGPGPVLTPDLIATDGRLADDPGYELRRDRHRPRDRRDDRCARRAADASCGSRSRSGSQNSLAGVFNDGWIGSKIPRAA